MDLIIQLIVGVFPAILSGFIAFNTAKNKAQTELEKAEKESNSKIKQIELENDNKLKQIQIENENSIKELKLANESKLKELREERKADLEYYTGMVEADNQRSQNESINNLANSFMSDALKDVESLEDLIELGEKFKK